MAKDILAQGYDHDALCALVTHWMRQVSQKDPGVSPDGPDYAAAEAFDESLSRFFNEQDDLKTGFPLCEVFGIGVELGLRLAGVVLSAPTSPRTRAAVADAVQSTEWELDELYDLTKSVDKAA